MNSLTGLNIQNFIVVDFAGLVKMIDSVGGVDLCIPQNVNDPYTGLNLDKGMHHLDGVAATQYARIRHGIGDGSDTSRTTRQQYLIKQLLSEALSKNLFTDTAQLYQLAKSALKSLNISQGMADTAALAGLAMSLKNFTMTNLQTQTVPVVPAPSDPNRSVWTDEADNLWEKMRAGKPIFDTADSNSGDSSDTSSDNSASSDDSGTTDSNQSDTTAETPDPVTGLITNPTARWSIQALAAPSTRMTAPFMTRPRASTSALRIDTLMRPYVPFRQRTDVDHAITSPFNV